MPADVGTHAEVVPELRDGYEVHQAALRSGLNVLLLPRQVMTAGRDSGDATELSFVHGVPQTSTLSAVTFAQDKRMRRALLTSAGLPIPKGGSYSVGRGMRSAGKLIARIGYPVVVKPAVGDNTIESQTGLRDEQEFTAAVEYLRTPTVERAEYTKAAYALTMLSEPEELDGRVVMPGSYRFLLERHVSGQYLRFLVIDDEVRSVVHCPKGPWRTDEAHEDVTATTHAGLLRLARHAVRAVPGLAIAAVDIVARDAQRGPAEQDVWIVELSERPWLAVQHGVSAEESERLGAEILRTHAKQLSVSLDGLVDEVAVDIHIEGLTESAAAVAAFVDAGRSAGLRGSLTVTDAVEGFADGVLQGDPREIARLTELLLDGRLAGHRGMLVEERKRAVEELDELAVRD